MVAKCNCELSVLRSNVRVLLRMNINELLDVQFDVNMLLTKRYDELKTELDNRMNNFKSTNEAHLKREHNLRKNQKLLEPKEEDEYIESSDVNLNDDTEEFILTQYDKVTRNKLLDDTQNSTSKVRKTKASTRPIYDNVDSIPLLSQQDERLGTTGRKDKIYSSPLKESLGSINIQEITETPILKIKSESEQTSNLILNSSTKRVLSFSDIDTLEMERQNKHAKLLDVTLDDEPNLQKTVLRERINLKNKNIDKKKLDFNINPATLKPWILEDFKPNHDMISVKRGKKKLAHFYNKVGKPSDNNIELKSQELEMKEFDQFQFDNLRQRTDSPPGFGRLDFPTTQERADDKLQSQKIIFEKTKYRFLAAVNNRIPPQEREYLFKKDELNEAVDNAKFTWVEDLLKIYPVV